MKYMLDTNILIKLKDRMRLEKVDDICISAITYAELEFGVSKSQNQEKRDGKNVRTILSVADESCRGSQWCLLMLMRQERMVI